MKVKSQPRPFALTVADAQIDDLQDRLSKSRFPDQTPGEPWAYGSEVGYMRDLVAYWREDFDWRAEEARLNSFPQFTLPLDGIELHSLQVEGQGPDPLPLLLLHGWPGSVFEFLEIIPRLTDPARFGGDPADSFTVIAPSLPGFGLSFAPGQRRFSVEDMTDTLARLMAALGYETYGAQGGDWGSFIASRLGHCYARHLVGIHLNLMPLRRDPKMVESPTAAERQYLQELAVFLKEETGYQWIQGTRPQTLAYGLSDSPLGLAAWIVEKFHRWTDCGGDLDSVITNDRLLANISLYWFSAAVGSSFWPYYARLHGAWPIPVGETIDVPTGYAAFPAEILRPPRSMAERVYSDLRRWTEMPAGGHFAALEQPEALCREIAEFFRPLRSGPPA